MRVNVHSKRSGDLSVVLAGAQAPSSRWIEALPACELPLSTIQNTVRADAYGSLVHHLLDEAPERLDPGLRLDAVEGWRGGRPPQAARYASVPWRRYSNSTSAARWQAKPRKRRRGAGWDLLSSPLGSMAA